MLTNQMLMMGLAAFAAIGFGYAFIIPYLDGELQAEKRQKRLMGGKDPNAAKKQATRGNSKVADTLKDIERREKGNTKLTLDDRLKQAGLDWSRRKFYVLCAVLGVVFALIGLSMGGGDLFYALGGLLIGTFGAPRWWLGWLKKRRLKKFLNEFPNAVDIIVRGVKSGLPLGDCIRIIATEATEPVRSEFKAVIDQQSMGLTLPESIGTLPKRIPLQEAVFFAIVVEIQSKSGGNLSEILGNLSKVLRDRKKMAGKIQAMSMEAKSSAAIIAALPFIVGLILFVTAPAYVSLLWTTESGKTTLIASAMLMAVGVAVMKKMIAFDF